MPNVGHWTVHKVVFDFLLHVMFLTSVAGKLN